MIFNNSHHGFSYSRCGVLADYGMPFSVVVGVSVL